MHIRSKHAKTSRSLIVNGTRRRVHTFLNHNVVDTITIAVNMAFNCTRCGHPYEERDVRREKRCKACHVFLASRHTHALHPPPGGNITAPAYVYRNDVTNRVSEIPFLGLNSHPIDAGVRAEQLHDVSASPMSRPPAWPPSVSPDESTSLHRFHIGEIRQKPFYALRRCKHCNGDHSAEHCDFCRKCFQIFLPMGTGTGMCTKQGCHQSNTHDRFQHGKGEWRDFPAVDLPLIGTTQLSFVHLLNPLPEDAPKWPLPLALYECGRRAGVESLPQDSLSIRRVDENIYLPHDFPDGLPYGFVGRVKKGSHAGMFMPLRVALVIAAENAR